MNKEIKSKTVLFAIIIAFVVVVLTAKYIYDYNNINSIKYNGRTYNKSLKGTNNSYDEIIKTTMDTGVNIKRMEVYDIKNNPNNSTVIYLKKKDGNFLMYELSGGP